VDGNQAIDSRHDDQHKKDTPLLLLPFPFTGVRVPVVHPVRADAEITARSGFESDRGCLVTGRVSQQRIAFSGTTPGSSVIAWTWPDLRAMGRRKSPFSSRPLAKGLETLTHLCQSERVE